MNDWAQVTSALLGTWPSQVASWGRDALAAYVGQLEARGLTPAKALDAILSCDSEFPPAAGKLAALACSDPSTPTFDEAFSMIYDSKAKGGRGVLWTRAPLGESKDRVQVDRAYELHPLLGAFVESYGIGRLRMLEVDHEDFGGVFRRELQRAWGAFVEANAHRDVAALVSGRRRELDGRPRRLDPKTALVGGGER